MSTLKLYKHTGLELGKHFIIENMENYLNQFEVVSISNFQYMKIALLMTIKVDMSQTFLAPRSVFDFDYLSIINPNESIQPWTHNIYYFFIVNKSWKSESTIELSLSLDTLNTYQWNTHYIVDKKTLVKREHKDRFSSVSASRYIRKIDLRSEDVNAPLYKIKEQEIIDKINTDWILYYKTRDSVNPTDYNQVNPVECYLTTKDEFEVKYNTTPNTLNTTNIPNGYTIMLCPKYSQRTIQLDIDGSIYSPSSPSPYLVNAICIKNNNNQLDVYKYEYFVYTPTMSYQRRLISKKLNVSNIQVLTDAEELNVYQSVDPLTAQAFWTSAIDYVDSNRTISMGIVSTGYVISIDTIDRTDSKNIKIINLPYSPTPFEFSNGLIEFDGVWTYEQTNKLLKLDINSSLFENDFYSNVENPMKVLVFEYNSIPDSEDLRNDDWESKIYHSDFYRPKFVYDSFSLNLEMEKVNEQIASQYYVRPLEIKFVMTRNIVSKFLFILPQYVLKYSNQDYDNVISVARNNEEVLYTSQYINYLRTGYNYDLKTKQRNEVASGIGLGASVLTTIAGVIGSVATGNYGSAILSGVVGGIGIATSSINYVKNVAQSEQNIQQKLEETRRQSVSVQNADDIDLLKAYSNNKAKMCYYEVSPTMKQALLDMFYYCGYATQEQKVPDTTTRYWFNFIQCDLVVEHTSNLPSPIMDDIKAKFSEGCTFFHEHSGEWDVEQTKENYESWILE